MNVDLRCILGKNWKDLMNANFTYFFSSPTNIFKVGQFAFFLSSLKGVFAKNVRGYRFTSKNIFLRSVLNISTFWICMDATFFGMSRFNIFLLIDATDRSKTSSNNHRTFFYISPSFYFSRTLPLNTRYYVVLPEIQALTAKRRKYKSVIFHVHKY